MVRLGTLNDEGAALQGYREVRPLQATKALNAKASKRI